MAPRASRSDSGGSASRSGAGRLRPGPAPAHAPDDEREMMVAAAYRVLASTGTASVGDILAETGLSTRSFYRHFKSKADLLLAMFDDESERMVRELEEVVDSAPNPRTALDAWVEHVLDVAFNPRRFRRAQVMLSPELTRTPSYGEARARSATRERETLIRILEAGAADGTFPRTDPRPDAVAIQDIVTAVLIRRRYGIEQPDARAVLEHVLGFVHRALG